MTVEIKDVPIEQKHVLRQLMQLYLYDFSEIDGDDVSESGEFPYRWLDNYWTESERSPFLVYSDGHIAGFALVRTITMASRGTEAKSISEFFIMRKYRRTGLGRKAAFHVFDRFRGTWEVRQTQENLAAQAFWKVVIGEYTEGDFEETDVEDGEWRRRVQTFDNSLLPGRGF
jgi:predicted acetyltransferase